MTDRVRILAGDVRARLAEIDAESVQCVVTSPPYWNLRDYGAPGQLGLEATPQEYVEALVEIMRAVRRVLRRDGTLWLNLGDKYLGGRNGGIGKTSLLGSKRNHTAARMAHDAIGRGGMHARAPGLQPDYIPLIERRLSGTQVDLLAAAGGSR